MKAATPPRRWASAMMCWQTVVLPDDSGPKISEIRPRGIPPTPRARSRAAELLLDRQDRRVDRLGPLGHGPVRAPGPFCPVALVQAPLADGRHSRHAPVVIGRRSGFRRRPSVRSVVFGLAGRVPGLAVLPDELRLLGRIHEGLQLRGTLVLRLLLGLAAWSVVRAH